MSKRDTRYQGAIIQNDQILLIRHREHETGRSYWILPGGGREPGETEEECILREMKEETGLDVKIMSIIMDEASHPDAVYRYFKTFLCKLVTGEASPGYEPEPEAAAWYSIDEVKWFDLHDESGWNPELVSDSYTYPELQKIRKKLGYVQ